MELLKLFADNLLPVFLTAGAGWALAATLRPDPRGIAQAGLYVLAPALILEMILQSRVPPADLLRMMLFAFACLALPAVLAFAFARWRGWSRPLTSAIVLTVMLTNAGNYGLSVNLLAFGERGLAQASLFFLASAIVSYTAGVFVASLGRTGVRESLTGLLRIPTVWAVVVAFAMNGLGLRLPGPAASAVHLLSQACIPVFLLVLGMQLRGARLHGPVRPMLFATAMRLGGGAAAGLLLAPVFGLAGVARQAGVLQSAMPSAVIATILATEYDVEPAFVTSVVLITTLVSPFTLTPLLAMLRAG
jgi:predicted permease